MLWIQMTEWMFWNFKPLVWSYSKIIFADRDNSEIDLSLLRKVPGGKGGKISFSVWSILGQVMVKPKSSLPLSCSYLLKSTLILSPNRRFWWFTVLRQNPLPKARDPMVLSLEKSCQEWREFAEHFFVLLKVSQSHYIFKKTNAHITQRAFCHQENVDRMHSQ